MSTGGAAGGACGAQELGTGDENGTVRAGSGGAKGTTATATTTGANRQKQDHPTNRKETSTRRGWCLHQHRPACPRTSRHTLRALQHHARRRWLLPDTRLCPVCAESSCTRHHDECPHSPALRKHEAPTHTHTHTHTRTHAPQGWGLPPPSHPLHSLGHRNAVPGGQSVHKHWARARRPPAPHPSRCEEAGQLCALDSCGTAAA